MEIIKPWKEVFVFRPLVPLEDCLRYADGRWISDDGKPDLAFVGYDGCPTALHVEIPSSNLLWMWRDKNYCWHYMYEGHDRRSVKVGNHPNVIAERASMDKCCEIYSVANGSGPAPFSEENIERWIREGKIWVLRNGKLIPFKKPKLIECTLCLTGQHDVEMVEREYNHVRGALDDLLEEKKKIQERLKEIDKIIPPYREELRILKEGLEFLKERSRNLKARMEEGR